MKRVSLSSLSMPDAHGWYGHIFETVVIQLCFFTLQYVRTAAKEQQKTSFANTRLFNLQIMIYQDLD